MTINYAIVVRLEAKPDKQEEVAALLRSAQALAEEESGTPLWFALRFSDTSFAVFDAFPDTNSREDHLGGQVAAALMAKAPELFVSSPMIEMADVIASKTP
jgi:quinol monooxygenase YgiN